MTTHPTSPLGDRAAVERATADFPDIAARIEDLEAVVTPEFDRADRAAIDTQVRLKHHRLTEIGGGVLVAVFALLRLALGDDARWAGGAAAVVAAGTGVVAVVGRRHGLEQWLDNRRIAEELRSLYFRWIVSVPEEATRPAPPADGDEGGDDRDDGDVTAGYDAQRPDRRRLRAEVNRIISVEPVRVGHELTGRVIDDEQARRPIVGQAWQLYLTARLRDQVAWMRTKSNSVQTRTHALQWGQVAMMTAAAVCGLASGYVTGSGGRILAVPVAATAVIVSFLATVDSITASDQLAQHYERTVRRLAVIERAIGDELGSLDDVEAIESVLLAEHRTWHRITEGNQQ